MAATKKTRAAAKSAKSPKKKSPTAAKAPKAASAGKPTARKAAASSPRTSAALFRDGRAAELIKKLRATREELGLAASVDDDELRELRPGLAVSDEMVELVASAAETHGAELGTSFDAAGARAAIAESLAIEPVLAEIDALAHALRATVMKPRGKAGRDALVVYASVKGRARTPEGKHLKDLLAQMEGLMKKKPRKKGG